MADLRVELLAVEDCPHLEQARRDLESVLRKGIIEVPIQLIFVASQDDAEFLGFQGSPTIRVNGEDVVPAAGTAGGPGLPDLSRRRGPDAAVRRRSRPSGRRSTPTAAAGSRRSSARKPAKSPSSRAEADAAEASANPLESDAKL